MMISNRLPDKFCLKSSDNLLGISFFDRTRLGFEKNKISIIFKVQFKDRKIR